MKIYTREQVERLVKESYGNPKYRNRWNNLKTWCKKNDLYYEGIVRFFKGSEININTYSRILHAVDPANKVITHYLANDLTFSDLQELKGFIKQLQLK